MDSDDQHIKSHHHKFNDHSPVLKYFNRRGKSTSGYNGHTLVQGKVKIPAGSKVVAHHDAGETTYYAHHPKHGFITYTGNHND